jgi:hypothetical protein
MNYCHPSKEKFSVYLQFETKNSATVIEYLALKLKISSYIHYLSIVASAYELFSLDLSIYCPHVRN